MRLGHSCDYSTKVSFKNDTKKVVLRYIGNRPFRSQTWHRAFFLLFPSLDTQLANRKATATAETNSRAPLEEDVLPNFTSLTNDEDWQCKAEHRPPGTYFVVVNQASFEDSDEYGHSQETRSGRSRTYSTASLRSNQLINDRRTRINRPPPIRTGSASQAHIGFEGTERSSARSNLIVDAETIILTSFEDPLQRSSPWSSVAPMAFSARELDTSPLSNAPLESFMPSLEDFRVSPLTGPTLEGAFRDQEDRLLRHYRNYVRRHVVQVHQETYVHPSGAGGQPLDLFELEAITFPPVSVARQMIFGTQLASHRWTILTVAKLFHALRALSALSLAHRDGLQNVDALQYYQKALAPLQNMRSEQDLASNGTFLTHFILLLYEVSYSLLTSRISFNCRPQNWLYNVDDCHHTYIWY